MFDQWTWKKHATTKPISQCSKVHVAEIEKWNDYYSLDVIKMLLFVC